MKRYAWLYYQIHGKYAKKVPRRRKYRRGPIRDQRYKTFIRSKPCILCGHYGAEAAHTGRDGAMKQKSSDRSCLPICTDCHTQAPYSYHRNKRKFEALLWEAHQITIEQAVKEFNREYEETIRRAA